MFNAGDDAIATEEIIRKDRQSKVMIGDRVKITAVYRGKNYTIVNIEPYSGILPIMNICCDHNRPLKKVNDKEGAMKTHLIFCCNRACVQKEMNDLISTHSSYQLKYPDTVFIGNERYIFLVDINRYPERIRGLLVDSFRTCSEYNLSNEVLSCLASCTAACKCG